MADPSSISGSPSGVDVVTVVTAQRISRSILLSSLALFAYDHFLLLPREIEKVWTAGWSPVKISYVALKLSTWVLIAGNLAVNLATTLTDRTCRSWSIAAIVFTHIAVFNTQWLLFLRVNACYSKKYTKILIAWLVLTTLMGMLVTFMFMRVLVPSFVFIPMAQCVPITVLPLWAAFANVPYMIFETSMFIAMVWRYAQRPHKNVSRANTLLNAVFNNAVVYFTWIVCIGVAISFISNFGPESARGNAVVLNAALTCSVMCRSVLDLRSLVGNGTARTYTEDSTSIQLSTVSAAITMSNIISITHPTRFTDPSSQSDSSPEV